MKLDWSYYTINITISEKYTCIPSIAEIEVSVRGCLERVLLAISSSFYNNKNEILIICDRSYEMASRICMLPSYGYGIDQMYITLTLPLYT